MKERDKQRERDREVFEGAIKSKKPLISREILTLHLNQHIQAHHPSQPGDPLPC